MVYVKNLAEKLARSMILEDVDSCKKNTRLLISYIMDESDNDILTIRSNYLGKNHFIDIDIITKYRYSYSISINDDVIKFRRKTNKDRKVLDEEIVRKWDCEDDPLLCKCESPLYPLTRLIKRQIQSLKVEEKEKLWFQLT